MVEYGYRKQLQTKLAQSKNMPLADKKKTNEFNRVAALYKFKARIPKFYFYTAKSRNVYEKRNGLQRLATQIL